MKKKLLTLMLASVLSCTVIACGGNEADNSNSDATVETDDSAGTEEETSEPETKNEEPEDDGIIDFEGESYKVTYTRHEVGTDYEGNPCLLFYYNFTNNGEEATSAMITSYFQCFQNGIECETAIVSDSNDAIDNYSKDIQPGVTLEVCTAFELDGNSEVTIEASDWASFSDDKDVQVITLE